MQCRKILIVFAQAAEAQETLKRLSAVPIAGEKNYVWSEGYISNLYTFDHGWIAISNLGLHAAQMATARHGISCEEIWNFGFAGSLRGVFSIGEIRAIEIVGKYVPLDAHLDEKSRECLGYILPKFQLSQTSHDLRALSSLFSHKQNKDISQEYSYCSSHMQLDPQIYGKTQEGDKLISSDFPIHDETLRKNLGTEWDLVDMEGYGVAFAAHALGKKCRIWKIISDFALTGGRSLIRKNKTLLSEKIADAIVKQLCRQ
jgi:nucleoside phosphorylase